MKKIITLFLIALLLLNFSTVALAEEDISIIPESLAKNGVDEETWENMAVIVMFAFERGYELVQPTTPEKALADFVFDPYCGIIFQNDYEVSEYIYEEPDPKNIFQNGFWKFDSQSVDSLLQTLYGFSRSQIKKLHNDKLTTPLTSYPNLSFYYHDSFYYSGFVDGFGGPYNDVESYEILKDYGNGKLYLQFNTVPFEYEPVPVYVVLEKNKKTDMPFCTISYISLEEYTEPAESQSVISFLTDIPARLSGFISQLFLAFKNLFS